MPKRSYGVEKGAIFSVADLESEIRQNQIDRRQPLIKGWHRRERYV
jgi:hypothetical protein